MAVISADELIARNQQKFQRYKLPAVHGVDPHLDPALDSVVEDALTKADLSKGVVLDGYPASKIQGDFLTSMRQRLQLPPPIVIHLSFSRQCGADRLHGQQRPELDQQLRNYREFDFIGTYFPRWTSVPSMGPENRPMYRRTSVTLCRSSKTDLRARWDPILWRLPIH